MSSRALPLRGQIVHNVASNHNHVVGKKRPRSETDVNASNLLGFVFQCRVSDEKSTESSSFDSAFQLVIPSSLTNIACRAAISGTLVEVTRYRFIRYRDGRGDVLSRGDYADILFHREVQYNDLIIIEVHRNGLALLGHSEGNLASIQSIKSQMHTLQSLSNKEQSTSKVERHSVKNSINLTATVDAISPIFTHETEQPFALLELYHGIGSNYSAVAVVRGKHALGIHAAIRPGVCLDLIGVSSRSWKVSQSFLQRANQRGEMSEFYQKLSSRTPHRVLLIEDPEAVCISGREAMPSTVESLTSVRGLVTSVNYYRYDAIDGNVESIVHFVTLKCIDPIADLQYDSDGNEIGAPSRTIQINLLKYSFSPHVMLGIQPGAILRALNIHCITHDDNAMYYVACLRSTIDIECCATENHVESGPFFISKQYGMVPTHRIDKICSDQSNSCPSTRYFEEDILVSKLGYICDDPDVLTRHIRVLLKHHYNMKDSSHSKLASGSFNNIAVRDPYSEFFDHAHSDGLKYNNLCVNCSGIDFHCPFNDDVTPNVVKLEILRNTCAQDFINRISSFCNKKDSLVSSGSTSSYHYYSSKVYVWGKLCFDGNESDSCFGYIHHCNCRIPFSTASDQKNANRMAKRDDYLGWLQVKSVLVSCLCLGRIQHEGDASSRDDIMLSSSEIRHKFLSSSSAKGSFDDLSGHNFVFLVGDLIFIGSIQFFGMPLVSDDRNAVDGDNYNSNDIGATPNVGTMSIQDCLKQTMNVHNKALVQIEGRLMRQRFRFRKSKHANYEGWTIVLSHIDDNQDNCLSSSSFLQTIEVNVTIPVGKPSDLLWTALKATLRDFFRVPGQIDHHIDSLSKISTDQLTMGLAFLNASEFIFARSLLSGGVESCNCRVLAETNTLLTLQSTSVHVQFPLDSHEITKLGYQSFKCRLEDLRAVTNLETFKTPKSCCPPDLLDFVVNTKKFLPGMLNDRLCRVAKFKAAGSALITMNGVVPIISLGDLHEEVCQVLSKHQPSQLHPSLLRRIHNAKILGIGFCRARVECTQCFEFLKSTHSQDRTLHCPKGCLLTYAAIKWECSALIDDGTGQAKLYAEREAALLLLGSTLDVNAVEKGAWLHQEGVFFSPSLPPSSYLRQCFKDASLEAKKHNTQWMKEDRGSYNKGEPSTAHDFINPLAKAEYTLQQHCRHWYQEHHHHQLDLFCRCKPLSTEVVNVNRSEIQVAKAIDVHGLDFGAVSTCSLPPLKLILEDFCVVGEEDRRSDVLSAWELLNRYAEE